MASPQAMLSDADIHGLVDGHLDGDKRAEILRRLAGSPVDRRRVETWQDQNELIRAAFASIEKEAVPIGLNVATPIQALDSGMLPIAAQARGRSSRVRHLAGASAIFVVLSGLGGLWLMLDLADRDEPKGVFDLRASIDDTLADRADAALDKESSSDPRMAPSGALPTTEIPDLSAAGFAFDSAEASGPEPAALLFHYRNASSERLVVGVTRVTRAPPREPSRTGKTWGWHDGSRAYAIAGTIAPEDLRAIAGLIQSGGDAMRH